MTDFTLRRVDPAGDAHTLHLWVTHPKGRFWGMADADVVAVEAAYAEIDENPSHEAFLGLVGDEPAFLVERYDPAGDPVGQAYDVQPGDLGMHVLVAPTETLVPGFTRDVFGTIMGWLFEDPAVERVVVEPDSDNTAVHALNAWAGFTVHGRVTLPDKEALLSFCTRADHTASAAREGAARMTNAPHSPQHLTSDNWVRATRWMVRKALAEFAHERMLEPVAVGNGRYAVRASSGAAYEFSARLLPLEHWLIAPESIVRTVDGEERELDALELFVDLRAELDLGPKVLPLLLEEVSATLSAQAYRWSVTQPKSSELVGADFQLIESSMREGHPCFVANSGRIGFDASEYERYAPEAAPDVRLVWLAARRERATFAVGAGMTRERLLAQEFSHETRARFGAVLAERGMSLDDVHLLPLHPWQWDNRVTTTFAADLVRGDLVLLGHGDDEHRPQQSIRTFFNTSVPERSYVKTALSVLNMGFLRGLSAAYMEVTPAINDHVADIVRGDETLQASGFDVLREHAAVGYRSPTYDAVAERGDPHLKMLAGLWRESPLPLLREGETLATMASLLHVDEQGDSFAAALVDASGLAPDEWVRRYLEAYLVPVVHCLVAHQLVFMPHGENLILVLSDGVVDRVIMKDIGEEVAIFDQDVVLPKAVERVRVQVEPSMQALSILTDVVDSFLRFLAATLDHAGTFDAEDFWAVARDVLRNYEEEHPHLAVRLGELNLGADEFDLSCLNRLQLRNNQQMVDLTDPVGALAFAGRIANPLAGQQS